MQCCSVNSFPCCVLNSVQSFQVKSVFQGKVMCSIECSVLSVVNYTSVCSVERCELYGS